MNTPRLEIDLSKIKQNTENLVSRLSEVGISITGITKVSLGSPEIALTMLQAGATMIGDSRIENIEAMSHEGIHAPLMLIRSPMMNDASRTVRYADISLNSELEVIHKLSDAAVTARKCHGIVLMIELGDLREGIMPADLKNTVRQVLALPGVKLKGIGANLACHNGVSPSADNMAELSSLANDIERTFGISLEIISGGNSANINWALSGADLGRINNLRLGESILFGREALYRQPIESLHTDAITLIAEVIESKIKPSLPWGEIAQTAFGMAKSSDIDKGSIAQAILAIGQQDVDPTGLTSPTGIKIIGASSDHLIIDCGRKSLPIGTEIRFLPNYSAVLRAMTSPFVSKVIKRDNTPIIAPRLCNTLPSTGRSKTINVNVLTNREKRLWSITR